MNEDLLNERRLRDAAAYQAPRRRMLTLGERERLLKEQQKDEDKETPSWWTMIDDAWEDSTMTASVIRWLAEPVPTEGDNPSNFEVTDSMLERYTKGIPSEYWQGLVDSRSQAEFFYKLKNLKERLKTRETLGNMGYTGTALSIGTSIADPLFFIAGAGVGGAVGKASQVGITTQRALRAKSLLRGSGIALLADFPLELSRMYIDDMTDAEQMIINTVASGAFGGALGGLFPRTTGFGKGWQQQVKLEEERLAIRLADQNAVPRPVYGPDP